MKLATDTFMLRPQPLDAVFRIPAEAGYSFVEFAPRDEVLPSYGGRRAARATIEEIRMASRRYQVGIASFFVEQAWGSSDERVQEAAVRYIHQAIETAVDVGCDRINLEFSGIPDKPREGEAALRRSLDALLPVCESEGVTLAIEPHPGDWMESGFRAVDFIRGLQSPNVTYLHCVPHTFFLTGVMDERGQVKGVNRDLMAYAGTTMGHVHLADTLLPGRTFLNPARADIPYPTLPHVRNHQHLDIGQGDVDWDEVFSGLQAVGFDGVLTVCVFRHEDRVMDSLRHNREEIRRRLGI
jgi:myo-inositol catabolism protein IolH